MVALIATCDLRKVTIMVSIPVRLLPNLIPPNPLGNNNRKINGPIYRLDLVKLAVRQHGVRVINDSAQAAMEHQFAPPMDESELEDFIDCLTTNHFHDSEWCQTSVRMLIDCDAYAMKWDRNNRREWKYADEIYVKFGFKEHHPFCIIVRVHPS